MGKIDHMDLLRYLDVLFRETMASEEGEGNHGSSGTAYKKGFVDNVLG